VDRFDGLDKVAEGLHSGRGGIAMASEEINKLRQHRLEGRRDKDEAYVRKRDSGGSKERWSPGGSCG